ncbi:MAG: gliding motility-associated C-terminal domain-containing protein [Candidatus Pacebacteria bacterium]|jgi:gliding motility-associated-like protein|nr:gliding motility-associated C-terminal domain-containing protein [Candidatus Paceibacterota bacterium]
MKKRVVLGALLVCASWLPAQTVTMMTVSEDINICHRTTTVLEAHRVSGPIDHFTWSWTSGTLTPLTSTNDSVMIAAPTAAVTSYYIHACDVAGNVLLTDSIIVYQLPRPNALATTDTTLLPGQPLVLTGWGNGIFLHWQIGMDTICADTSYSPGVRSLTMSDPTPQTGQYLFIARGLSGWLSCIDTAIVDVTIADANSGVCDAVMYIPNAFTPEGDGVNDVFIAKANGSISDLTMLIFDRWGNLVFQSNSLDTGWDGTHGGRICQQDVYVYHLSYRECGLQLDRRGHVTLIR